MVIEIKICVYLLVFLSASLAAEKLFFGTELLKLAGFYISEYKNINLVFLANILQLIRTV